jgi:hypothetical protein
MPIKPSSLYLVMSLSCSFIDQDFLQEQKRKSARVALFTTENWKDVNDNLANCKTVAATGADKERTDQSEAVSNTDGASREAAEKLLAGVDGGAPCVRAQVGGGESCAGANGSGAVGARANGSGGEPCAEANESGGEPCARANGSGGEPCARANGSGGEPCARANGSAGEPCASANGSGGELGLGPMYSFKKFKVKERISFRKK